MSKVWVKISDRHTQIRSQDRWNKLYHSGRTCGNFPFRVWLWTADNVWLWSKYQQQQYLWNCWLDKIFVRNVCRCIISLEFLNHSPPRVTGMDFLTRLMGTFGFLSEFLSCHQCGIIEGPGSAKFRMSSIGDTGRCGHFNTLTLNTFTL